MSHIRLVDSPQSHGSADACALVPKQPVGLLHPVPVLHLLVVEFSLDGQHVPQHRHSPPQGDEGVMGGGGVLGNGCLGIGNSIWGRGREVCQVFNTEEGMRYMEE